MIVISLIVALLAAPGHAREGFFPPAAYTALAETGISAEAIANALPAVGGFLVESPRVLRWKEVESLRSTRCGSDIARTWNREFCAALAAAECEGDGSCRVLRVFACGGVVVDGFFVTTRSCVREAGTHPLRAKFLGPNGLPLTLALEKTALTDHTRSDDLSLLRAPGFAGPQGRIRRQDPKAGEPVFGAGFPSFASRDRKSPEYRAAWGDPRVVLGRVLDSDSKEPREPSLFLTDTDTTEGMNGSPLFDKRGRLVGIKTSALDKAQYVSAKRIEALIGELAEAEKQLAAETKSRRADEQLKEARRLEKEELWEDAEAAYKKLKVEFGELPAAAGTYAELADASLSFLSCETGRDRPRRTFPRLEYLESVALSALSDGSRDRLLHLLPCRTAAAGADIHAEELVTRLFERRIVGAPAHIRARERFQDHIEAELIGLSGDVVLIWKRDINGGWEFGGARLE